MALKRITGQGTGGRPPRQKCWTGAPTLTREWVRNFFYKSSKKFAGGL